jgi:hypothetical protein
MGIGARDHALALLDAGARHQCHEDDKQESGKTLDSLRHAGKPSGASAIAQLTDARAPH